MVDPQKITNFNRTDEELQEFLIFAVAVGGKTAGTTAKKVDAFLESIMAYPLMGGFEVTPFSAIMALSLNRLENVLLRLLKEHKLGKYDLMMRLFSYISWNYSDIKDLKKLTLEELEKFPGIGMKTSRFFILHSRKNPPECAALDTHVLKYLKQADIGNSLHVPQTTPSGPKRYLELERVFLLLYHAWKEQGFKGTVADLDLTLWRYYNNKIVGGLRGFLKEEGWL